MKIKKTNNFRFKSNKIKLSSIIELKWINNKKIVRDFKLNLIKSSFSGFNKNERELIQNSWEYLKNRAENFLSPKEHAWFTNKKDIRWEGFKKNNSGLKIINISKGIDYKSTVSIRSNERIYNILGKSKSPKAFVVVSILITKDNKIVLGKRKFYGDWPIETYELPGAFLHENDINLNSLIKSAIKKVSEDYKISKKEIKSIPLGIYYLPRILEVVLVCVSKTEVPSNNLKSDFYKNILVVDNTIKGVNEIKRKSLNSFHPPSRVALEFYFNNFKLANKLLNKI